MSQIVHHTHSPSKAMVPPQPRPRVPITISGVLLIPLLLLLLRVFALLVLLLVLLLLLRVFALLVLLLLLLLLPLPPAFAEVEEDEGAEVGGLGALAGGCGKEEDGKISICALWCVLLKRQDSATQRGGRENVYVIE